MAGGRSNDVSRLRFLSNGYSMAEDCLTGDLGRCGNVCSGLGRFAYIPFTALLPEGGDGSLCGTSWLVGVVGELA